MAARPDEPPLGEHSDSQSEDQSGSSSENLETPEVTCKYKQVKKVQLFLQLKALKNFGENLQTVDDGKLFLERVKHVPEVNKTIKQLVDEIQAANPEQEPDYESLEILEHLCEKINSQATAVREELGTRSHHSKKSKVKNLPRLSLPKFSGELEDWPAFKRAYEKMIHNNEDLSVLDKIKYLIGCVEGNAIPIIEGVPPLATNYQFLWQCLDKKFNNKRIMADSHFSELLAMEPEPEHNLTTLNLFLENFHSKVRALHGLLLPDLTDYFLSYLAYSKLPADTKMLFDEEHRRTKFFTYDELISFVESEKGNCTRMIKRSKKQLSLVNTNEMFLAQATFCVLCTDGKHPLNTCPNFRQMTSARRWIVVKQYKRCPNCLKYHGKKTCMSRATCTTCNRKHHHLLHQEKQNEFLLDDDQPEFELMEPTPSTSAHLSDASENTQDYFTAMEESQEEYFSQPGTPQELPEPADDYEDLSQPGPSGIKKSPRPTASNSNTSSPDSSNHPFYVPSVQLPKKKKKKKSGAQEKDDSGEGSKDSDVEKLSLDFQKL